HDRKGRLEEALRCYSRALEVSPGFVEARRFRAVVRARQGDFANAREDINRCLQAEPQSGATLYAAACVAALTAEQSGPPAAKEPADQALEFLRRAFARGYGLGQADTDRDLEGVRQHPGFRRLLRQARK